MASDTSNRTEEGSDQSVAIFAEKGLLKQEVTMTEPTQHSDQTVTSADAESADKIPATVKTPAEDQQSNNESNDFAFILRTPSVLKHAVEALSDPSFNPKQKGVVQVGDFGFEITVLVGEAYTKKEIFGYLRLLSAELEEFICRKPLEKMISLKSLHCVLKAAVWYSDDAVAIFSKSGSNKLTLQWGKKALDFALGQPISIDLNNVGPEHRKFPNVTYGFEAVIPSNILIDTLTEVLHIPPKCRPKDALATFKAPKVQIQMGDNVVLDTEEQVELHEVWVDWEHWESLKKASNLADKCSMYLVTDPPRNILLRFSLGELGDMVYLFRTKHLSANTSELPFLGLFRSLKTRRFFTRK